MLKRFCLQILPSIHDKTQWLDLDSSSIKHVLRVANYSNLDSLGLYNIDEESAQCLFTGETLSSIFKNQITTLFITIYNNNDDNYEGKILSMTNTYDKIFTVFNRLTTFGDLPNLKCFSLSCKLETYDYNEAIPPLLYRMSNLEELDLCLTVYVDKTFIDGNHLKTKIIKHIPRLNQFTFFIQSFIYVRNEMSFPSTEDFQHTFIVFPNNKIISYVDNFADVKRSQCHIYSYPFLMRYSTSITNNFSGGLFEYVRSVSLFDEHPFEHEFFLRIVQSFPFIEGLSLANRKPQNGKQSYKSNSDNRNLPLIEYFFLNELYISNVHDDYIEQFLFDTKTYLQNNVILYVDYESLQRVTHNFARDATPTNSAKISKLHLCGQGKRSNSLEEYFPYSKISYPLY
ncbi:unnamed protein product [Rotaria sp. Silwood1]|nr:unnamed protein product [Rotaria sp. Silwood1]